MHPVYMHHIRGRTFKKKLLFSVGLPFNMRKTWKTLLLGGLSLCIKVHLDLNTVSITGNGVDCFLLLLF